MKQQPETKARWTQTVTANPPADRAPGHAAEQLCGGSSVAAARRAGLSPSLPGLPAPGAPLPVQPTPLHLAAAALASIVLRR